MNYVMNDWKLKKELERCKDFKKCFEDLYKMDAEERVVVSICGFCVPRSNYFGGDSVRRIEVKLKMVMEQEERLKDGSEDSKKVLL